MSEVIVRSGALIELTAADVGKYIRLVDTEHMRVRMLEFNPNVGDEITLEHVCMKTVVFDTCVGATLRIMDRFYPEILGMYGVVSLKCVAANEWVLFGALIPRPEWQIAVDEGLGLTYDLYPTVNVNWQVELARLEESIGSLVAPTSATIVCTVTEIT